MSRIAELLIACVGLPAAYIACGLLVAYLLGIPEWSATWFGLVLVWPAPAGVIVVAGLFIATVSRSIARAIVR